jgi:anti-sigma factor RsiW
MKCAHTHDSGPYVLGALLSADREAYEQHLATCASCRDDVAELAVLPGLLGRLDLADVEAMPLFDPTDADHDCPEEGKPQAAPALPGLLSSATRHRARQRRRQRWRVAGAALVAAAVAVLALVIGDRALSGGTPARPPDMALMQPVAQPVAVTGWVSVRPFDGGSRIQLRCGYNGGADGVRWTFRLVVVSNAGAEEPVGSWTAEYGQEVSIAATTALAGNDIARIELRSGSGKPLLSYVP